MAELLCKCGCGLPIYAASKSGYARGHQLRGAIDGATPPRQAESQTEPDPAEGIGREEQVKYIVTLDLEESTLDLIWTTLPPGHKGLAIATALAVPRA